jgi:hypothetical protein
MPQYPLLGNNYIIVYKNQLGDFVKKKVAYIGKYSSDDVGPGCEMYSFAKAGVKFYMHTGVACYPPIGWFNTGYLEAIVLSERYADFIISTYTNNPMPSIIRQEREYREWRCRIDTLIQEYIRNLNV